MKPAFGFEVIILNITQSFHYTNRAKSLVSYRVGISMTD